MLVNTASPIQQILQSPWAVIPLRFLRASVPGLSGRMPEQFGLEAVIGLAPVLLFLAGLLYIDSFKLVRFRTILFVLTLGALSALASYFLSGAVIDATQVNFWTYSRFCAPLVEEGLKGVAIVWLFGRNRIGFMVDAAILGLGVGAGFSVMENIYYAYIFPEANVGLWIVRGLGTAIMHGGVAAIFAIMAQMLRERHANMGVSAYLPGLLAAAAIHCIYNQFIAYPVYSAAGTILILPLMLLFLFDKSEHEVHDWLIHDYETHQHLLDDINSGKFTNSQAGRFIASLSSRFSETVVALIFAYIKLHTELVLRAEKILLARENGEPIPPVHAEAEHFTELHTLEKKIGRTALLAIWPHLKFSRKELFELHKLEQEAR